MHESALRLLDAAKAATADDASPVTDFASLAKSMNISAQRLGAWKNHRGVSKQGAIEAERLYGCSVSWIMEGIENPPQTGKSISSGSLLNGSTVGPQLITWERIMGGDLPEVFRVAMPDDAMAPDAEMGWEVEFVRASQGNNGKPGQGVLVRDPQGNVYFRRYTEGAGSDWLAVPNKKGYRTLDSVTHEISVIAVMTYVRTPALR